MLKGLAILIQLEISAIIIGDISNSIRDIFKYDSPSQNTIRDISNYNSTSRNTNWRYLQMS